jgi:hypothetical protein
MTTAGVVTDYPLDGAAVGGLGSGPDGNMWFSDGQKGALGRVVVNPAFSLDRSFDLMPAVISTGLGKPALWALAGPSADSLFDNTGMSLFASALLHPTSYWTFTFPGAGTYTVAHSSSSDSQTVKVPTLAVPKTGMATTTFTITWATAPPPTGIVFDVQIKRPGSTQFVAWKPGVVTLAGTFVPDAGTGTYQFRARVRSPGLAAQSGYSAPVSIKVN